MPYPVSPQAIAEAQARAEWSKIERAIDLLTRYRDIQIFPSGPDADLLPVMATAKRQRAYRRSRSRGQGVTPRR
jgi:hypothetical protein